MRRAPPTSMPPINGHASINYLGSTYKHDLGDLVTTKGLLRSKVSLIHTLISKEASDYHNIYHVKEIIS